MGISLSHFVQCAIGLCLCMCLNMYIYVIIVFWQRQLLCITNMYLMIMSCATCCWDYTCSHMLCTHKECAVVVIFVRLCMCGLYSHETTTCITELLKYSYSTDIHSLPNPALLILTCWCVHVHVIMPWWAEPQRYTVVVVCVCVHLFSLFLCNCWKVQCKCKAIIFQFNWLDFWFVCDLWRGLLTLTTVTSSPETREDQFTHGRLLVNVTVPSV